MHRKNDSAPYIKDLNTHRLQRLERWRMRLFPLMFIGAAILFTGAILAIFSEADTVEAWAVVLFLIGLGITAVGVFSQGALLLFTSIEEAIQKSEDWMGDKDDDQSKKKKKKKRS